MFVRTRSSQRILPFLSLVLLATALAATPVHAAGDATTQATGDAQAQFDARFAQYKEFIRDIEQLRNEYQSAGSARRTQINSQLADRVAQAQETMNDMVRLGVEAYQQAPEENEQLGTFLTNVAQFYVVGKSLSQDASVRSGGDYYDEALPIISTLIEGGNQKPILPLWGFVCAFVTNDYDQAREYLDMARERNALVDPKEITDPAQQAFMESAWKYAASLDTYRELWAQEQEIRAAEAEADDLPRVKFSTTEGDVVLELFENEAPNTVANFLTLVGDGYYDGTPFHRVLSGFMAQGGSPGGAGDGGPGYMIACECYQPNYRHHFRGSLSMAHAGRDTGGSQFFLTFVPTDHLDGAHTVFGRVIEGMDVLAKLQRRSPKGEPSDANLPKPDKILKAEVLRQRDHPYQVRKVSQG